MAPELIYRTETRLTEEKNKFIPKGKGAGGLGSIRSLGLAETITIYKINKQQSPIV